MSQISIIGHRGSAGTAPENTLRSFQHAIDAKAYGIEFDVQVCATGELMVLHDSTVDRTTNGQGRIAQMSFAELRKLDAGEGEKIPLLSETLDLLAGKLKVNIELKSRGTAAQTADIIDNYVTRGLFKYSDILVSSFLHPELSLFQKCCPQCLTAGLISHVPLEHAASFANRGFCSLNIDLDSATPEFINSIHLHGMKAFVYTVNKLDDFARMQELGVDGVFTNYPQLFGEELKRQA